MNLSYRVVAEVAAINEAVVLGGLIPDTQYQVTVAAIWNGRKHLSRPIVFRTLGEIEGEIKFFLWIKLIKDWGLFANL